MKALRRLMSVDDDMAVVALDSWGLRKLFSHLVRRWLSGANKPKDPSFEEQHVLPASGLLGNNPLHAQKHQAKDRLALF